MPNAPLSEIVDVDVEISASKAAKLSFGVPLILDGDNVLNTLGTVPIAAVAHEYASIKDLELDGFKTWHKAHKLARLIFAQIDRPKTIKVAGWKSDTATIKDALTGVEAVDTAWYALLVTTRADDSGGATAIKDAAEWCDTIAEKPHLLVYETGRVEDRIDAANLFSELKGLARRQVAGIWHGARPQRIKLTLSRSLVTGNTVSLKLNGVTHSVLFAADSDATLAALATAIATNPAVARAVKISGGAVATDDRSIVVTGAHGLVDLVVSDYSCTGGVAQANLSVGENDLPIRALTMDAALVAANSTVGGINGTGFAGIVFGGDSDTTLAAIATAFAGLAGVGAAVSVSVAAAADNDRVIEVYGTSKTGKLNVTSLRTTGGASQPNWTVTAVKSSAYAPIDAAWLGRCVAATPGLLSWADKALSGAETDSLSTSERAAIVNLNGNFYATFGEDVNMTRKAMTAEGVTIRNRILVDWLKLTIQAAVVSVLATEDFVPYTDAGIAKIGGAVEGVLLGAKIAGALASFSVTVPTRASVPPGDVASATLNGVTFTALSAGEIQSVSIAGKLVTD